MTSHFKLKLFQGLLLATGQTPPFSLIASIAKPSATGTIISKKELYHISDLIWPTRYFEYEGLKMTDQNLSMTRL